MREDSNWFLKWEEELPSPEDLMPLSQTLITPDLASVFDIRTPSSGGATTNSLFLHYGGQLQQQSSSTLQPPTTQHNSSELDSSSAELCGGVGGIGRAVSGADESARTLKRPRLVWTPQLHKRFVDAVAHLGIKNAVPKTIMQLMSVDGLTRENVASHLQKYRLYLKRMQGIHNGAGNGPGHGGGLVGSADSATDHLFASSPVPAHFLSPTTTSAATVPGHCGGGARPNSDRFYMPVAAVNHQRMAAAVAGHQQSQGQYNNFGPGQGGGQFDHLFLSRQAQLGPIKNGVELGTANNGRKILTLFPTDADD